MGDCFFLSHFVVHDTEKIGNNNFFSGSMCMYALKKQKFSLKANHDFDEV